MGVDAWQVPHPVPEPTAGVTVKLAPKGLSVRMDEWQVRHPAPACAELWPGEPSPAGWPATASTWESEWQRRSRGQAPAARASGLEASCAEEPGRDVHNALRAWWADLWKEPSPASMTTAAAAASTPPWYAGLPWFVPETRGRPRPECPCHTA